MMNEDHDNITALATYEPNAAERKRLIKQMAMAPQATDDEFKLFLAVAGRLGLDPPARQIYAIHRGSQMTIQTGIDGFRSIASDTGQFAGEDDAEFGPLDGDGHPEWARVTVYRQLATGYVAHFTSTARWAEYRQLDKYGKLTGQWPTMPHNQLAKCAEAQSLRKGFPKQLSGIYTDDEMGQADNPSIIEHAGRRVDTATGEVLDADAYNRQRHDEMNQWTDKAVPLGKPAGESAKTEKSKAEPVNWGPISGRLTAVGIPAGSVRDNFAQWATREKGKPNSGKSWEQLTDADVPRVLAHLERIEEKHRQAEAALAAASTQQAALPADEPASDSSDQGEPEPPDEAA